MTSKMTSHSETDIGKCIRVAQAIRDIKSSELAEGLGVVPQQVNRWRNASNIRFHQVQRIAQFFDMTLDEFVSLDR